MPPLSQVKGYRAGRGGRCSDRIARGGCWKRQGWVGPRWLHLGFRCRLSGQLDVL